MRCTMRKGCWLKRMFLALFVLAFAGPGCEDQGDFPEITYVQEPCFGSCPSFSIHVYGDGSVVYMGRGNVLIRDTVIDHISRQQVGELIAAFTDYNYFSLRDEYSRRCATDYASARTSFAEGGTYKSVRHYFGDCSAPRALELLYPKINKILGTERWVGHELVFAFM